MKSLKKFFSIKTGKKKLVIDLIPNQELKVYKFMCYEERKYFTGGIFWLLYQGCITSDRSFLTFIYNEYKDAYQLTENDIENNANFQLMTEFEETEMNLKKAITRNWSNTSFQIKECLEPLFVIHAKIPSITKTLLIAKHEILAREIHRTRALQTKIIVNNIKSKHALNEN